MFLASTVATARDLPGEVGLTVGTLGNPFFVPWIAGARDAVEERIPGVEVTDLGADYDLNKQTTQIENFIGPGLALIIINAVDAVAIEPTVNRAKEAGITVAAIDVTAAGADLTVMANNKQAGEITASTWPNRSAERATSS